MNKNVLVVVDAQNDFIDGSLANVDAQAKISNIVNKINNFDGGYIFATRDTHDENYLSSKEGQALPIVHCLKDTNGWNINSLVAAALESAEQRGVNVSYINKKTFGSKNLCYTIRKNIMLSGDVRGDIDIEIVGFCTDICVVSNALLLKEALYKTANITVDASCCAGLTPAKHAAALDVMKSCQINVINE